jgi:hypothetical protein
MISVGFTLDSFLAVDFGIGLIIVIYGFGG